MPQERNWKVIGHRGFPTQYPENTLPGFRAAIELGADAVEMDVQLSEDGVPVVIHDIRLDRTCDDIGSVLMRKLSDLKNVSAHQPNKFKQQFYPAYIASLEESANAVAKDGVQVFIEIKRQSFTRFKREEVLDRVLTATEVLGDNRVIISFDLKFIALAKALSKTPVGWCVKNHSPLAKSEAENLEPDFLICKPSNIVRGELWPGKWQWMVYDVKTLDEAQEWVERGAKYIETDYLDLLLG